MDKRRLGFWLVFLGAAAVLALIPEFFGESPDDLAEPVVRRGPLVELRSDSGARAPAAQGTVAPTPRGGGGAPSVDLFASQSWYVAPPPPPPPPPPRAAGPAPAPSAPPLPFQYLGKLDDSERLRVFLLRGERIHTVSVGDVIDGTYRVERIDGGQMTLIYLPLNISQTLSVGSAL
jgi:hypothetical protein